MNYKVLPALIAAAALTTSCATIVSGSKQDISFRSTPAKASVIIDGNFEGRTPLDIKLVRKKAHTAIIRLDGYKEYQVKLERKFNAWFIGNIAFGGIIGIIVDPITGAMYRLTPDKISTDFGAKTASLNKGIYIEVALQPDASLEKIGQMERE